ncbi:MAG: class I SAM-dependent methyltransferase [Patescibacteria group bacterium]
MGYEQKTGSIYGTLFKGYSENLFDKSVELFEQRHNRWGIDTNWFKGKVCLDAGCGGGRFVIALAKLEAKRAYGIDISEGAVEAATERARVRNLTNTEFVRASVLQLPFPDKMFDYVVSSGVIHHTPDPKRGFDEIVRVLKPGGRLFLSVYGKGGTKWFFKVDIWRYTVAKLISFSVMEKIWKFIGVPANKRYALLDNLYVEYCFRFKEKTINDWLLKAGFGNIRRVKFERYDYKKPLSRIIYGEGWIQVYADKLK